MAFKKTKISDEKFNKFLILAHDEASPPQPRKFKSSVHKGKMLVPVPEGETEKLAASLGKSELLVGKGAWQFKGPKGPDDPARHGQLWTTEENFFVIECYKEGDDAETIARKLERKVSGTLARMSMLKLVYQKDKDYYNFYRMDNQQVYWTKPKPPQNMMFKVKP